MKRKLLIFLFIILYLCASLQRVRAQDVSHENANLPDIAQLTATVQTHETDNRHRQEIIANLSKELEQSSAINKVVHQDDLSAARFSLEQEQVNIEKAQSALKDNQMQISNMQNQCASLSAQIQKLSNPLGKHSQIPTTNTELDTLRQTFEQCQKILSILQKDGELQKQNIQLIEKQRDLLQRQYQRLNDQYLSTLSRVEKEENKTLDSNDAEIYRLNQRRDQIINTLKKSLKTHERLNANIELALISKQQFLLTMNNEFGALNHRLEELQFADFANASIERINSIQKELNDFSKRITNFQEQLNSNLSFIDNQYAIYKHQENNIPKSIDTLYKDLQQAQDNTTKALTNAQEMVNLIRKTVDNQFTLQSKNYLKQRYSFIESIQKPHILMKGIFQALQSFLGQYAVAFQTLFQTIQSFSAEKWTWFLGSTSCILLATLWLTIIVNHAEHRYSAIKRPAFSTRLSVFMLGMLKYILPYIGLLILVSITLAIANIPFPSYQLILLIPVDLLLIVIPLYALKILPTAHLLSKKEARRISQFVTFFSFFNTGLLSSILLARWVLNEQSIINFFSWFYGLFILLIVFPTRKGMKAARTVMDTYFSESYTYRILRILLSTIPLCLLSFAVVNTLGYLNLSWAMANYLLISLFYIAIWIALLSCAHECSLFFKRYALVHTSKGVFWAQDIINPIHTLFRFSSFFVLIYALLQTFNWNSNTPIITEIIKIFRTPLFHTKDNSQFTLLNLVLMVGSMYFIFRIGAWAKSIAYRWVYAKIHDTGLRNSFSVFTQYAIVTLGFLLSLRIIGLDLTTFTVFAGALGVGIGFGLQTIANNFISGLLLLIERPLRNGDTITVGEYNGKVSRIGMRSLTITTFNNESVILPNSDFITSAFKNWSHSDQLLRVVFYLDLNHHYDPQKVQDAFNQRLEALVKEDVISNNEDFPPNVFAYDYSDRGITYRVQFYVDLEEHRVLRSRHRVIREIWDVCKEQGFEIAHMKTDVFLQENVTPQEKQLPFI